MLSRHPFGHSGDAALVINVKLNRFGRQVICR